MATIEIVRAVPDDWRDARRVRLAALADAPDAFAASWAREAERDEAGWRERLSASATAVAAWARDAGAATLTLWVVDDNERARRCYERLGFAPDGARQPLPGRPDLPESRMRRDLALY